MSYKNGKIELLNMDCMEYMRTVPDKYFDLAIVDPPYGIGADKEKYTPENETWKGKKKKGYLTKKMGRKNPYQRILL